MRSFQRSILPVFNRSYCSGINVTSNTIQRVLRELEIEGIIYTQRGIGVFITEDMDKITNLRLNMSKQLVEKFIGSMRLLGFSNDEIIDVVIRITKAGLTDADSNKDKGSM